MNPDFVTCWVCNLETDHEDVMPSLFRGPDGQECRTCYNCAHQGEANAVIQRLGEIQHRLNAATRGPWLEGGPVSRNQTLQNVGASSLLSQTVWEVGRACDRIPPGICVVNDYFDPETGQRTPAADNAALIGQAPQDLRFLLNLGAWLLTWSGSLNALDGLNLARALGQDGRAVIGRE